MTAGSTTVLGVGILDEDIAKVRAAVDFVQVAGEHIALRKVGRRWVGLCPFHAEKTPSFSVNAEEGLYYCFGCQARGDVITFVREVEHLDFAEAVERLAGRAGIQLRYDSAATSRDRQRRAHLVEAMAAAVQWYHERLLDAPDAAAARAYLRSRGYDGDVVRTYRLGWAPDEWDALARALRLPDDVLRDTGLGFLNRRNRAQDAFRSRVMFPIFRSDGDPVAFGGRAMPGQDGPKYKNSPATPCVVRSRGRVRSWRFAWSAPLPRPTSAHRRAERAPRSPPLPSCASTPTSSSVTSTSCRSPIVAVSNPIACARSFRRPRRGLRTPARDNRVIATGSVRSSRS